MRETGQYRNALAPHLWRDGAAQRRHYKTHRPLKGKRLTTFCASLALLHPLLSLTHWIFGSLMLPYKSSSHSAKCVRCAPQGDTTTLAAPGCVNLKNPTAMRPVNPKNPPRAAASAPFGTAYHLSAPLWRSYAGPPQWHNKPQIPTPQSIFFPTVSGQWVAGSRDLSLPVISSEAKRSREISPH